MLLEKIVLLYTSIRSLWQWSQEEIIYTTETWSTYMENISDTLLHVGVNCSAGKKNSRIHIQCAWQNSMSHDFPPILFITSLDPQATGLYKG